MTDAIRSSLADSAPPVRAWLEVAFALGVAMFAWVIAYRISGRGGGA